MPAPDARPTRHPSPTRAVLAATVGNALEFYDFVTYTFFAIQIGRAFFPAASAYSSLMLSLATFGAGFVTRPIGGVLIGAFADRRGRRAAMMLSFLLMGFAVTAMALIPSYATIGLAAPILAIAARLTMGFALGGEVGPTTAYLLESAPPKHKGLSVSLQGASQSIASTLGATTGFLLARALSPATLDTYGWRIAFALGAVTIPFGLWIRLTLPETLHAPEDADAGSPASPDTPGEVVRRAGERLGAEGPTTTVLSCASPAPSRAASLRAATPILILSLAILAAGTIRTYVVHYMTTYAQNTLHFPETTAFTVSILSGLAMLLGTLLGGHLSDRLGRRPVMIYPHLALLLLTYPAFLWIVRSASPNALYLGIAALSLLGAIASGGYYVALAESLPKHIRSAAFSTTYALAIATFGGTCQPILQYLLHTIGNPLSPAWYLLAATLIGQIAIFLFPETHPLGPGNKKTNVTL